MSLNRIKESAQENLDALRYLVEDKKDEAKHFMDVFVIDKIKFYVKNFFDKYLPCLSSFFEEDTKYTPPNSRSTVSHFSFSSEANSLETDDDSDSEHNGDSLLSAPKAQPPISIGKNGSIITSS